MQQGISQLFGYSSVMIWLVGSSNCRRIVRRYATRDVQQGPVACVGVARRGTREVLSKASKTPNRSVTNHKSIERKEIMTINTHNDKGIADVVGVDQKLIDEQQKMAVCKSLWDPVQLNTTIVLPMAKEWYSGMPICDTNGKELFKVSIVRTETFTSGMGETATDFKYRQAVLTSPDGHFGAFITNKFEKGSYVNWLHFAVYTPLPHYQGQLPVDVWGEYGRAYIPDEIDHLLGSIYQHGKFICVDVWKDKYSFLQCTGPDEYEETLCCPRKRLIR